MLVIDWCRVFFDTLKEVSSLLFASREVSEDCEPVTADDLEVGKVYFDLGYADWDLLIPSMETLVLVKMSEKDGLRVFLFQTATAHFSGIPIEDAGSHEYPMLREYDENSLNAIFDFEGMFEQFLICSLRREKFGS